MHFNNNTTVSTGLFFWLTIWATPFPTHNLWVLRRISIMQWFESIKTSYNVTAVVQ